jgi:hypothetical protein
VLLGGQFTRVGSAPQSYLAQVTPASSTDVPEVGVTSRLVLSGLPNPSRGQTSFGFTLPAAGPVSLVVHDVTGRRVATVIDGEARPAGPNLAAFATDRLEAGLYFVRLEFAGEAATTKLVVVP